MMDHNELLSWLMISLTISPNSERFRNLLLKYGSAEDICEAAYGGARDFFNNEVKNFRTIHKDQAERIISYCNEHNIEIIAYEDKKYPKTLKHIYDPPSILYCCGNSDFISNDSIIAVVGARKISEYGMEITQKITYDAVKHGITIASGFAVGVDITAHMTAVRNGGKTVAVLGCGIGYPYPRPNMQYFDEIAENGAFISEFPPNTPPAPVNFPRRNRILVGISSGVAVMEASAKSGSLNSASHAVNQGKNLFVVPPKNINDSSFSGNSILLQKGAYPICSSDEIIKYFFEENLHDPSEYYPDKLKASFADENPSLQKDISPVSVVKEKKSTSSSKANVTNPDSDKNEKSAPELNFALDGNQKIIYDIIKASAYPVLAEDIADKSGLDISEVLSAITDLELSAIISSNDGQTYKIK